MNLRIMDFPTDFWSLYTAINLNLITFVATVPIKTAMYSACNIDIQLPKIF